MVRGSMLKRDVKTEEEVINIEAGMKGSLKFSNSVNLRINGKFEGELETKGNLTIGENADVKTKLIKGENITILGKVKGDVVCSERLEIFAPAKVIGNIQAPILVIKEGAMLRGNCQVLPEAEKNKPKSLSKRKK